MPNLFGTDGVRGVANRDLTPDLALALGRAAGRVIASEGGEVAIGRDTRISGGMLEGALIAGLCSAGVSVKNLGIVPTPAVAHLVTTERLRGGGMVSASHNPVPDNGIKFFDAEGLKISAAIEDAIEAAMAEVPSDLPTGTGVGNEVPYPAGVEAYLAYLVDSVPGSLDGLKVVLDCAFGAAWQIAPDAFRAAGAEVIAINAEPDGARINVECGSTSLDGMARVVVAEGADMGLAFDGDADRVLAVDESGAAVNGDRLIALAAVSLHERGALKNDVVVSTVMANLGFTRALEERGIEVVHAPVGDKFVVQAMIERGASLGGEQSGHIIFMEHATTGDGVLAGLQLGAQVAASGSPLSKLAGIFEDVPQVLVNVPVERRDALEGAAGVWEAVETAEAALGEEGRVLLRPSGTEQLIRVMVEALDPAMAQRTAESLAEVVRRSLGG
ncbi:MAG: phosphoglucosamine mutase [Actinomycetota bacterium]